MYYLLIVGFILSVVFVEGVTELVCKSLIFSPLRNFFSRLKFVKELITCGYCTSVWVAFLPAFTFSLLIFSKWYYISFSSLFLLVVLHRLSNYLHNINDKYFDKYYDNRFKK